jgi:hypothetical protein
VAYHLTRPAVNDAAAPRSTSSSSPAWPSTRAVTAYVAACPVTLLTPARSRQSLLRPLPGLLRVDKGQAITQCVVVSIPSKLTTQSRSPSPRSSWTRPCPSRRATLCSTASSRPLVLCGAMARDDELANLTEGAAGGWQRLAEAGTMYTVNRLRVLSLSFCRYRLGRDRSSAGRCD